MPKQFFIGNLKKKTNLLWLQLLIDGLKVVEIGE